VMARNERDFGPLLNDGNWSIIESTDNAPAWTDDYSNVLDVFRPDQ
jgi:hypothetical protein